MRRHYLYIEKLGSADDNIPQDTFSVIWNDVIAVSLCVYENLVSSFMRLKDLEQ